jgi:hypothetical protein
MTTKIPVYYNDGCQKDATYVYISSKVKSVDPDEHTLSRMSFCRPPKWAQHDLNWNVVSVCYFQPLEAFCALSIQGDVSFATQQGFVQEKIADAGTHRTGQLGAVKQIRAIGDDLFVCGDQGQVYWRNAQTWMHLDDGLLDRAISASALDLNSIDGTSIEDIYVCGMHGRIFHFDGRRWSEIDSPTNVHLERVRCVSRDEVYFCGNDGVFLKKTPVGFEDHSTPELGKHFWGLEHFSGNIYLAALNGLYLFDGSSVEAVETRLEPAIGGYRLSARDGTLWSFGVDDLAWFDGKTWTRVDNPNNV